MGFNYNVDISDDEKKNLYNIIKTQLGAPIIDVPLTDEQLDALFVVAFEEYQASAQNFLTTNQWNAVWGLNIDSADFAFYLLSKELKFEQSFTYAYSKLVGHGTNGPWELKWDKFTLSAHTQRYSIPAGREINEILWYMPVANSDLARLASASGGYNVGGLDGFNLSINGFAAYPINYVYNVVAASNDINMRNRIRSSDFYYKINKGPEGRIVTLYPVPGGRFDVGFAGWSDIYSSFSDPALNQHFVWYSYYDEEIDGKKCVDENDDVVLLPSDIPYHRLKWNRINAPFKTWIRKYLLSEAKMTLSQIFGRFGNRLPIPDAEITMNGDQLLAQAQEEKNKLMEELKDIFMKLDWVNLMEGRAKIAKSTNEIFGQVPNFTMIG